MERYNFKSVEQKWQKKWEQEKTFSTKIDKGKNIQAKKIVNTILSNVPLKSTRMVMTLERRNPVSSVMYEQLNAVLQR